LNKTNIPKKFFKMICEDNFYINIHELINIHILSADSHLITFVYEFAGPRPVRRDWLIHLIGIASKLFFSLYFSEHFK